MNENITQKKMKYKQSFQTENEKSFLQLFEKNKNIERRCDKIFFKKTKKYFFE